MQRNSPGAARDGGPVVLHPIRATPCLKRCERIFVEMFRMEGVAGEWRNTSWRLLDEMAEKDSASVGFADSKENKWVGS